MMASTGGPSMTVRVVLLICISVHFAAGAGPSSGHTRGVLKKSFSTNRVRRPQEPSPMARLADVNTRLAAVRSADGMRRKDESGLASLPDSRSQSPYKRDVQKRGVQKRGPAAGAPLRVKRSRASEDEEPELMRMKRQDLSSEEEAELQRVKRTKRSADGLRRSRRDGVPGGGHMGRPGLVAHRGARIEPLAHEKARQLPISPYRLRK